MTATGLIKWEQYLRGSAVPRSAIDDFLQRPGSVQFDPEVGYILHDSFTPGIGIDGSGTIQTVQNNGTRSGLLYAQRKPRINTYGDSFTEGAQVSDGETWQEYLAGHFGEPLGNFGVGGHGVYQAYRRLLRHEKADQESECVVLYCWGDDTTRSLSRVAFWFGHACWANVELDLARGSFVERENLLPTPASLYNLCDPEWMVENRRDDFAVQLIAYGGLPFQGRLPIVSDLDRGKISQLADAFGYPFDWSSRGDQRKQALELANIYGQRATNYIFDKARTFTRSLNKKLLVLLNFTSREDYYVDNTAAPYRDVRADHEILEHLIAERFDYFDMNDVHHREHGKTTESFSDYMTRYLIPGMGGHYNPRGNHLFAYSIKNKLLEMLDPQPLPYRDCEPETTDFSLYRP